MYRYGAASEKELVGVDPGLVAVARLALTKSSLLGWTDWTVHDGIRTIEEQRRHVANGVSETMDSKHLEGLAIDLVPWIDGKPRWWWGQIYQIAGCMLLAAHELNIPVRWGCIWDRPLNSFMNKERDPKLLPLAMKAEGLAYNARHPGVDFPDGPHFERIR